MAFSFTGLDSYKLSGVTVTNRMFGRGAYATVLELEYMGLKCAGKKIHELLLTQGNSAYAVHHFQEECHLLSRLHHPNIVQFLGVYFEDNSQTPILVMEYLPTNLTTCIEDYGVLPEEIGYPILHDVALGLCYLHNQRPPIIHRDLSSNNVLLSANLTAKISDLGVARILNMSPMQASRMTRIPGTPAYMPPEAMLANPSYDASVDMFSLGIMMIHVYCGKWPEPQVGQIRMEGSKMIPISEAERRGVFLDEIGQGHSLMGVILQCINNDPQLRPSIDDVVKQLAKMANKFGSDFSKQLDKLVRSRTDTIEEGMLRRSISEGSEVGGIRRKPAVKKKPSRDSDLGAVNGVSKSATCSLKRGLQMQLAIFEDPVVKTDVSEKVRAFEEAGNSNKIQRDPAPLKREPLTDTSVPENSNSKRVTPEKNSSSKEATSSSRVTPPVGDPAFVRKLSKELEHTVSVKQDSVDDHDYVNMSGQSSFLQEPTLLDPQASTLSCPIYPVCVAKYNYTAQGTHELSFRKGDLFTVTHDDKNWWMARSMDTGEEGIIPSNYMCIPLEKMEADPCQIQLVKRIGAGSFSTVWEGRMNSFPVAVKALKPEKALSVSKFLKKATLAKILSYSKIVHPTAVCTKKMPVYIVSELMKHGSLLRYLRNDGRSLRTPKLMAMATDVAEAGAYLEDRGYIHRDIAARNVLVGENLICKLSNFHSACKVHGDFHEVPRNEKFPIKWTAPEAFLHNRVSTKSDVWSFGILLFEIITYGRFPYPDMTNAQVLEKLPQGYRMPQPIGCSHKLYNVMLDCWKEEPKQRPTFKVLRKQLKEFCQPMINE